METITYQKILVPYDFGPEYKHSLSVAKKIAETSGASITLLHAVNPCLIISGPFPQSFSTHFAAGASMLSGSEKALKDIVAASGLPATRFDIKIIIGSSFFVAITALNRVVPHDLIVVPDFNRTFAGKLLAPIDALELMEKVSAPVIAVNSKKASFDIQKIVLPVRNVKNWFDKVPFTLALAAVNNAKIIVLGLIDVRSGNPTRGIRKKLGVCRRYLEDNHANFEIATPHISSEPDRDTLTFAEEQNADLISVTPPQRFFKLSAYRNKYFYNKIVCNGNIPVFGVIS